MQLYVHMKNSLITNFFGQPSLLSAFDDTFDNLIDCSVDSYKYRTVLEQKDDGYTLVAQVPGLSKEDITMSVENNTLKVSGQKEISKNLSTAINKEFKIGNDVNQSKISAKVENGVLYIDLPKAKDKTAKIIKIN
jgi:HSP20 family protein